MCKGDVVQLLLTILQKETGNLSTIPTIDQIVMCGMESCICCLPSQRTPLGKPIFNPIMLWISGETLSLDALQILTMDAGDKLAQEAIY
jgi:hypothetical protein